VCHRRQSTRFGPLRVCSGCSCPWTSIGSEVVNGSVGFREVPTGRRALEARGYRERPSLPGVVGTTRMRVPAVPAVMTAVLPFLDGTRNMGVTRATQWSPPRPASRPPRRPDRGRRRGPAQHRGRGPRTPSSAWATSTTSAASSPATATRVASTARSESTAELVTSAGRRAPRAPAAPGRGRR